MDEWNEKFTFPLNTQSLQTTHALRAIAKHMLSERLQNTCSPSDCKTHALRAKPRRASPLGFARGAEYFTWGLDYFCFLISAPNTPSKQTAENVRASIDQANHLHALIDDSIGWDFFEQVMCSSMWMDHLLAFQWWVPWLQLLDHISRHPDQTFLSFHQISQKRLCRIADWDRQLL